MNRTLKRPMFRMGGSAAEGITSGLDKPKRGLVNEPGKYSQAPLDLPNLLTKTREQMTPENIAAYQPFMQRPQGEALNRFLINFGLDLASRPPTGRGFSGLIGTAASAAKAPTEQLFADIDRERLSKQTAEADLFKTLLEGNIDIAAAEAEGRGEGGAKAFAFKEKADDIENTMDIIFGLRQKKKDSPDGTLSKEDQQLLSSKELRLQNLTKTDEVVKSLLSNKDYVQRVVRKIKSLLLEVKDGEGIPIYAEDGSEKEAKLIEDIQKYYLQFARTGELPDFSVTENFATGGRAGYMAGGGADMSTASATTDQESMPTKKMPIDYDTLRARLPKEITDDVVRLIAASPEALEDFATIATQQDVDQFNQKYSVNLVLPQEA
jgi:hypothetical protein